MYSVFDIFVGRDDRPVKWGGTCTWMCYKKFSAFLVSPLSLSLLLFPDVIRTRPLPFLSPLCSTATSLCFHHFPEGFPLNSEQTNGSLSIPTPPFTPWLCFLAKCSHKHSRHLPFSTSSQSQWAFCDRKTEDRFFSNGGWTWRWWEGDSHGQEEEEQTWVCLRFYYF